MKPAALVTLLGYPELDHHTSEIIQDVLLTVEHRPPFLPASAIRRLFAAPDLAGLDATAKLKLADWITRVMLEGLSGARTDRRSILLGFPQAGQRELTAAVPPGFYRALETALTGMRREFPMAELCFRLRHIAGASDTDIAHLVPYENGEKPPNWIEVLWHQAADVVEAELQEHNAAWNLEMLETAGLCPAGEVTRILDDARAGQRPLGDAFFNEDLYQELRQAAEPFAHRRDPQSLINESFLRMTLGNSTVPENRARFRSYAAAIFRNLANQEFSHSKRAQPANEAAIFDQLLERLPPESRVREREQIIELVQDGIRALESADSELYRVMEVSFLAVPGDEKLVLKEQAKLLGISLATLKRKRIDVQKYFRELFAEHGMNLGHYEHRPRKERLENLYQLVYELIVKLPGAARGRSYRAAMIKALNELRLSNSQDFEVLDVCYLSPLRAEAEALRELNTGERRFEDDEKLAAKQRLAEYVFQLAHAPKGGHPQ